MMTPTQWEKIKQVLRDALELDADQWPHYLERACGNDDALREQVEALLQHHDSAEFMARPVFAQHSDSAGLLGTTLGRYRIVRALGAGGMGEVFEAQQLEPFERTVAIKLLQRGLYSRELTERFDSEHRALAMMNHPNIAQVFDADWTEDERPYFVMEYVPGQSITEALAAQKLSLRQRIELFLQVCDGVEHAHRKGIIHRDLKPSNVLVRGKDASAIAKIIDFGVAKGARRVARSNDGDAAREYQGQTRAGAWIGTSGYASPEQAMGSADIDTRSDIYSLGALLYELLAQRPAYDETALANATRKDRLRIICDEMPAAPSETCSDRDIAFELRGDLDQIVYKAMSKQPDERYATVSELGADLRRYLDDKPVLAMQGNWRYRFIKLLRRRSLVVVTGLVSATLILAATIATGLGYVHAVRAQKLAAAEAQRANTEAERANQIAEFLAQLFRVSDPTQGADRDVSAREILRRGAARLDEATNVQPATRALLLDTIGVVYTNLGLYDEADEPLRQALELRRSLHGDQHLDTAASLNHLGKLNYFNGQL